MKPILPILDRRNPLTRGLVLCAPFFENGGGQIRDLTRKNAAGSVSGITFKPGQFGRYLTFATGTLNFGTGAYVNDLGALSILIRNRRTSTDGALVYKSDGDSQAGIIFYYEAGSLTFDSVRATTNCSLKTSDVAAQGVWANSIVTYDGSLTSAGMKIYGDRGVLSARTSEHDGSGAHATDAAQPLYIGHNGGGVTDFAGDLERVYIWNRVLTAGEIRILGANPDALFTPARRVFGHPAVAAGGFVPARYYYDMIGAR